MLLLGACGGGAERDAPPRATLPALGVNDSRALAAGAPGDPELPAMGDAGVGVVRIPVRLPELEVGPPDGTVEDFGPLDRVVEAAAAEGLTVLPVLFWTAGRGSDPAIPPRSPAAIAAFAADAAAVARRYGDRMPVLEVWNEPNSSYFWPDALDPAASFVPSVAAAEYGRLLGATVRAVRDAAPGTRVMFGGLSDFVAGADPAAFVSTALATAAGTEGEARCFADAFSLHPYGGTPAARRETGSVAQSIRNVEAFSAFLRDELDAGPGSLWITELGWQVAPATTLTEADQAGRLREALDALLPRSEELGLGPILYYNWRDSPNETFGLNSASAPREALAEYARRAQTAAPVPLPDVVCAT